MKRQVEGAPVHRQQHAAAERAVGRRRARRAQVDAGPRRVPAADLEHRQVERPPPRDDLGELHLVETAVAAEVHADPLASAHGLEPPRRPQRGVAIARRAAREVARRQRVDRQARHHLDGVPPVDLLDLRRRYAPPREPGADPEGHHEPCPALAERHHRVAIEVVVVIVRHHDHVGQRQIRQRDRHWLEPLGPREADGRRAPRPHRIDEHGEAEQIEPRRRVAEPRDARALGIAGRQPRRLDHQAGQRPRRLALAALGEEAPGRLERAGLHLGLVEPIAKATPIPRRGACLGRQPVLITSHLAKT